MRRSIATLHLATHGFFAPKELKSALAAEAGRRVSSGQPVRA